MTQLTKAVEALVTDYGNDFEDIEDEYSQINESEKTDALEVLCFFVLTLIILYLNRLCNNNFVGPY